MNARNRVVFAVLLAAAGYCSHDPKSTLPIAVASAQFHPGGGTEDGVDPPVGRPNLIERPDLRVGRPTETAKTVHIGGEDIELHFYRAPLPPQPSAPTVRVTETGGIGLFEQLAQQARDGYTSSATRLWQAIDICHHVPATQSDQEALLDRIRKSVPNGVVRRDGQMNSLESLLADAQRRYSFCDGIGEAQYAEALELLRDAAGIDTHAMSLYAGAIRESDPAESKQLYEALWRTGYLSGLSGLASYGSLPAKIASHTATIAEISGDSENAQRVRDFEQAKIDELRETIGPAEYWHLEKEAAELLHNPSCCFH